MVLHRDYSTSKVLMFIAGEGSKGRIQRDGAKVGILRQWRCCTGAIISALACAATITLFV